MMRVFVGLSVSEAAIRALTLVQVGLPAGRVVAPENLHLTLAFLGDRPNPVLEDLHSALEEIAAPGFAVELAGLGIFGGARPRSLHAAVRPNPALKHLRAKVQQAARDTGIDLPRERFVPHVTLARFPRDLPPEDVLAVEAHAARHMNLRCPAFEVSEFHLYRSHLTGEGAQYERLTSYGFAG